jgi:hypothetical protein
MAKRSSGEFLGVEAGWHLSDESPINSDTLREAFDQLRNEATAAGCASFPTREDFASHPALFDALYDRYEALAGSRPDEDTFRRHVCTIHKSGGTPE